MINPETLPRDGTFGDAVVTGCYRHTERFCALGGGSSAPSTNTVTQTQEVPAYVQQESQSNQDLANSLASQPYPNYQGQLIAPMNDLQNQGIGAAANNAFNYQPTLEGAIGSASNGVLSTAGNTSPQQAMGTIQHGPNPNNAFGTVQGAQNPFGAYGALGGNPGASASQTYNAAGLQGATGNNLSSYMSPYVMQSLAPQLQQLQNQFGQQNNQLGAQATAAGAFGDARQGAEAANNNFNNNILQNGVVAQGLNNAYGEAQNAFQADQANKLGAYGTGLQGNLNYGANSLNAFNAAQGAAQGQSATNLNAFNAAQNASGQQSATNLNAFQAGLTGAQNEQNIQINGGNALGNLAGQQQALGLGGANALYNSGSQQQSQTQQQLNTAYQQFQNQVNWPAQGLALRESAISNNPYTIQNSVSLPNANGTAQNLGAFSSLAGGLGSLFGSGNGSSSGAKL